MGDLHPNSKIWIYSDSREGVFGDGKLRLLKEIDRQGSLSEAAQVLGISYRKAWGDVRKAEACLQMSLIEKSRGGKGGGQSCLTPKGRELIKCYTKFQAAVRNSLQRAYEKHMAEITK